MSLLSRISGIQGQQRQRLISHRQRQDKAKAEAERGPGDAAEEAAAPIVDFSTRPDAPIPARVLFKALVGPLTLSMGCDAAEVAWIEENWAKEPDLIPTLVDWSRKVILEGVEVPEDVRVCCDHVYRHGAGTLSLVDDAQSSLDGDEPQAEASVTPDAEEDAPRRRMKP